MRPNPMKTYAQQRCAHTRHLRKRAQRAEAEAAALRAEVETLRRGRREERAALSEFTESPIWERDLLVMARDRVRAELIDLSTTHKSCRECGSYGRSFSKNFLQAEIDALTTAHDLPAVPFLAEPNWPSVMGRPTHKGRPLDDRWHTPPPTPRAPRRPSWDR